MLCILKRALRAPKWVLAVGMATLMGLPLTARASSIGLIISEFMADPPGTDGSQEYVELLATRSINFSVTPYSVVFTNNGTASTSGWVYGSVAYGFSITTGTVAPGDVIYVGGTAMAPTGAKLRVIDIANVDGDRFGNKMLSGVLGNDGTHADGVAVFDTGIYSLNSSSVPIDAIFYGTGIGNALVSSGAGGYQLPVNDLYNGGKLQTNSFRINQGSIQGTPFVATGTYDVVTATWTTSRTYAALPATDGESAIQLRLPAPPVAAVPLPAAVWGGAGLMAFVGLRRAVGRRAGCGRSASPVR